MRKQHRDPIAWLADLAGAFTGCEASGPHRWGEELRSQHRRRDWECQARHPSQMAVLALRLTKGFGATVEDIFELNDEEDQEGQPDAEPQ